MFSCAVRAGQAGTGALGQCARDLVVQPARVLPGSATRAPAQGAAEPGVASPSARPALSRRGRGRSCAIALIRNQGRPGRLPATWPGLVPRHHRRPGAATASRPIARRFDAGVPGTARGVQPQRDGHDAERRAYPSGHVHHPTRRRRVPGRERHHDLGVVGGSVQAQSGAEQAEQYHGRHLWQGRAVLDNTPPPWRAVTRRARPRSERPARPRLLAGAVFTVAPITGHWRRRDRTQ